MATASESFFPRSDESDIQAAPMNLSVCTSALSMLRKVALGSSILLAGLVTPVARADNAPMNRQLAVTLGLGPAINIDSSATQFKLVEELMYHIDEKRSDGLAFGVGLSESFGSGFTVLTIQGRIAYDALLYHGDVAVLVTPTLGLGAAIALNSGASRGFFNLSFATDIKIVFSPFLYAGLRFVGIDAYIGDFSAVRYDLLFLFGATI